MKRTDLLKRLNKALSPDDTAADFSAFDEQIAVLKKNLAEKINIKTVDDVSTQLEKFRRRIDLAPLIEAIDGIRNKYASQAEAFSRALEEKSASLEQMIKDGSEAESIQNLQLEIDNLRDAFTKNQTAQVSQISSIKNQLADLGTLEGKVVKAIKKVQDNVTTVSAAGETSKETTLKMFADTEGSIESFRQEMLKRLSSLDRGGSINQKISVNGTLMSKKYADFNLVGSVTAADNNTSKRVDITLTGTGPGGSNTQVQFNNNGAFGGDSGFTYGSGAAALSTSLTSPLLIGGTGTTSALMLQSTSGIGTAGADIIFQTGNNGATEAMRILNNGKVGIGTAAPTHSLTLNSTSNGTAIYNTSDQTTNYERIVTQWSSNLGVIAYQGAGTSPARTIFVGTQNPGSGGYIGMKINRSSSPFIQIGSFGTTFVLSGLGIAGATDIIRLWDDAGITGPTSGQLNVAVIKPVYNQTLATGILNTDFLINRTETSLGTTPGAQNFIDMQVAGTSKLTFEHGGAIARYSSVATAGWGVPAIYGSGRSTAQTAAVASVATYTVGAADGSFLVSANANITAFTAGTFNVTVAYTDETNTSRTLTLNFSSLTGTLGIALAAAGPFEGVPAHIRCKAATTITVATSGTFTSLTYNVEGVITQIT